jgi:hypothetical protein
MNRCQYVEVALMLWRIDTPIPQRVRQKDFGREGELEELLKREPNLLNESLLLIGQQVTVSDVRDKIDLLAIDTEGRSVIIEVKRGTVKTPDDLQSIRYASYIANWNEEQFRTQANRFYEREEHLDLLRICLGDEAVMYDSFDQVLKLFCDEEYQLNHDQRIILVGSDIGSKLFSALMWMYKKGIDAKFVQVQAYQDESHEYITPITLFPLPEADDMLIGTRVLAEPKPWIDDGRDYHLKSKCSPETANILDNLASELESCSHVERVVWRLKYYIAVRVRGNNWAKLRARKRFIRIEIQAKPGVLTIDEVAHALGIDSANIDVRRKRQWEKIYITFKPKEEYNSEGFKIIAQKAIDSFKET